MIEIRFVAGVHKSWRYPKPPKFLAKAGLTFRFAVIQETFAPGCADMYFDEVLWKTIVDFARRYGPADILTVAERMEDVNRREIPIDLYLWDWEKIAQEDRDPPQMLLLRDARDLRFCAITEYWNLAGGPKAYHDSYTYALFSARDLSEGVPRFLRDSPDAARWEFTPVQPAVTEPIKLWEHWLAWLTGTDK
jgi:hypothetical protein